MPTQPTARDRLMIALRLSYPPDLPLAARKQLAERVRRSGSAMMFGAVAFLIVGIVDLIAAIVTKNPVYFVIGVIFVGAGYLLYRHVRAARQAVGAGRR